MRTTKYNRIKFFDEWLSASEIARRHGLSTPTVLKRYAQGYRDRQLVAEPGTLPKGAKFVYRSQRIPTPMQAYARLRKAKAAVTVAIERLAHAKALGEGRATIGRLERQVRHAELRRMYCTSMAMTAEEMAKSKEIAA